MKSDIRLHGCKEMGKKATNTNQQNINGGRIEIVSRCDTAIKYVCLFFLYGLVHWATCHWLSMLFKYKKKDFLFSFLNKKPYFLHGYYELENQEQLYGRASYLFSEEIFLLFIKISSGLNFLKRPLLKLGNVLVLINHIIFIQKLNLKYKCITSQIKNNTNENGNNPIVIIVFISSFIFLIFYENLS